jgi:hypothetical protein
VSVFGAFADANTSLPLQQLALICAVTGVVMLLFEFSLIRAAAATFVAHRTSPAPVNVAPTDSDARQAPDTVPAQLQRKARFNNFVARNWRGEFPLWVSFWVFPWLGTITVFVLAAVADSLFSGSSYDPRAILTTLLTLWFASAVVSTWHVVGVWRSATGRSKTSSWTGLAKLSVILGALAMVARLATSGAPQVIEAARIAFLNDPDIPAYSIRIMRNSTEAEVSGGIKYGLSEDLTRILRAAPQIRVVHLDSTGGRVAEAEQLYKIIHDRGLNTYVSNECLSACTVAFAGGRERWIDEDGKLGFHAMSFPGTTDNDLSDARHEQEELFENAGFDPAFAARIIALRGDDWLYPTTEELIGAKVIIGVAADNQFAASGLGVGADRNQLAAVLKRTVPALAALEELQPTDYGTITDACYDAYLSGQSFPELYGLLYGKLMPIIGANLPLADDATLRAFGQVVVEKYMALASKDPVLCYKYAAGITKDVFGYLPPELRERDHALDERILRTATNQRSRPSAATIDAAWGEVGARTATRIGLDNLKLVFAKKVEPKQYADYCRAVIVFRQEILKLDDVEAAALMRQIVS